MPWDEIKPRKFSAFDKELEGISKLTMDWDHVNRQLIQAEAAREGAQSSGAEEQVPVAH